MKEEVYAPDCGRENDLIAFLYGELDPGENSMFRSHMLECQSCAAELREFTNVRESVVAWRDEALVGIGSPVVQAPAVLRSGAPGPNAWNALREFFNLSPLWMKSAVVFASVLFCLFAVLAAARLRETPQPPIANNGNTKSYSEQELHAVVAQRVQDELKLIKNSTRSTAAADAIAERPSDRISPKKAAIPPIAANGPKQQARRPLSRVERQELAADLRLIDNPTEGELDLLDDRINQ